MRVVVTGGAGFIGSHVVRLLLAQGHTVLVLDNLSQGKARNVTAPAVLRALDVAGAAAAKEILAFAPNAVVHLAAQMDVGASVRAPLADAHTNVLGTLNVLHAAHAAGATVFVAASSGGAVYGASTTLPTAESAPWAPMSPYGASKACSEIYLAYMARNSAALALANPGAQAPMRCVSLRPSNVYGPGQSHEGEAGVVAIFAERMLRGTPPTVCGDGEQTRDFVYVDDVARAFVLALHAPEASGAFNVGTGKQTSLLQLARVLVRATGYTGELAFCAPRPGEVRDSSLCAKAYGKAVGWQPTWSLALGLERTVAALREAATKSGKVARPRGRSRRASQAPQLPN